MLKTGQWEAVFMLGITWKQEDGRLFQLWYFSDQSK